jgi:hypothetical protein
MRNQPPGYRGMPGLDYRHIDRNRALAVRCQAPGGRPGRTHIDFDVRTSVDPRMEGLKGSAHHICRPIGSGREVWRGAAVVGVWRIPALAAQVWTIWLIAREIGRTHRGGSRAGLENPRLEVTITSTRRSVAMTT